MAETGTSNTRQCFAMAYLGLPARAFVARFAQEGERPLEPSPQEPTP
jgi:hypothetical protein